MMAHTINRASFAKTEMTLTENSTIEKAYLFGSSLSNDTQVNIGWSDDFAKNSDGGRLFISNEIVMTLKQAEHLLKCLTMVVHANIPDEGDTTWVFHR